MPPNEKLLTAIDVGSTKVIAAIAEPSAEGELVVLGVGISPARGVRRGAVADATELSYSIREAVVGAQATTSIKVTQAMFSIDGDHIASQSSHGVAAISRGEQGVTKEDIRRSLEASQALNLPSNREVLHVLPCRFRVDDQHGVRDPLGMLGFRLEVDVQVVTGSSTVIQNLIKCARSAGVEVSELVVASLASAEAVLTPDERQMGVALVDIGGGLTSIALIVEGAVWFVKSIEVGGGHFTSDLAQLLRLPLDTANHLKENLVSAYAKEVPIDQMCELIGFGSEGRVRVLSREASEIVQARAEELFDLIEQQIARSGYSGLLPAGLVLTGGGSQLRGLDKVARGVTQRPVRVAAPNGLRGMTDALHLPSGATIVGMLRWGMQGLARQSPQPALSRSRSTSWNWLKRLLPG
ncbi:MAG: cell division protein FtsA [Thermoflexales bacterium]